jgi:hypothetical protein
VRYLKRHELYEGRPLVDALEALKREARASRSSLGCIVKPTRYREVA